MTLEQAMLAGLSAGFGVLGWLARELWSAVQALRQDLSKLEVRISAEYVRQDRMDKVMEPVMRKLDRIEEVLNHKVDK